MTSTIKQKGNMFITTCIMISICYLPLLTRSAYTHKLSLFTHKMNLYTKEQDG